MAAKTGAEERDADAARGVFGDVLCAIDGTRESIAAVEHAAALAAPGARATVLVVTSYEVEGELRSPEIGPGRAKAMIDEAVAICDQAGLETTVQVDPAGPPSQLVLDWAEGHGLLALGAPATSWFGSIFAGGVGVTAEEFFDTPMLLARSASAGAGSAGPVLVASDGTEGSDELARLAVRVARSRGASLMLVHARSRSNARSRRIEAQSQELERAMDGAFEMRLVGGPARTAVVEAIADAGPALVVMGSRRLRGLRIVGSVSRRVVHAGGCSVLLVPPERLLAG
jgi:nucleotide-binding universal stress UspA family protein